MSVALKDLIMLAVTVFGIALQSKHIDYRFFTIISLLAVYALIRFGEVFIDRRDDDAMEKRLAHMLTPEGARTAWKPNGSAELRQAKKMRENGDIVRAPSGGYKAAVIEHMGGRR